MNFSLAPPPLRHYELAIDASRVVRLATAFDELKPAI